RNKVSVLEGADGSPPLRIYSENQFIGLSEHFKLFGTNNLANSETELIKQLKPPFIGRFFV
ncbi:MAG TPA: hypothetical protein PK370_02325, partial [Candidatus Woesebacteria bacterium]|nr:hypothetical protein [Candidatus Woesebacteria bacterium]